MANVFLNNESFTLSGAANVFGAAGTETVVIGAGATGVVIDQNVEAVNLSALTGLKYLQAGNTLKVYAADGTTLLATTTVQADANGTVLTLPGGSTASAILSGGVMTIGGAAVSTTTPATLAPTLTIAAGAASASEGTSATYTVTRGGDTSAVSTVNFTITPTGATAGTDFGVPTVAGTGIAGSSLTATGGTITFAVGATTATVNVPFLTDSVTPEAGESVALTLSGPVGASLGSTITASTTITDVPPVTGQTFVLTPATTDVFTGNSGNDTITGAVGTLQTGDTVVDGTTTDNDTLTVSVSTYAAGGAQPTVVNIENVNVAATVLATGLDLTNVTGTKVLTLSSATAGTTGTVDTVAATRVASIVAGTNVGTLNVNAAAAGTGSSVAVNTGSASTTTITGNAAADTFAVTVGGAGQTLNLLGAAGTDIFNVTLPGGSTTLTTDNGLIENLNLVSGGAAANTVTVAGNAAWSLTGAASGNGTTVTGTQNLTLTGDPDQFTGLSIVKGSGYVNTITLKLNAGATAADLSKAVVDVVQISADLNKDVKVNVGSTVKLSTDQATANTKFQIDNAAGTLTTGTLTLEIGATQTKGITTDTKVATLALTPTSAVVVAGLTLDAATTGVTLSGTKDLTLTKLTVAADGSFVSTGYSGNLTIADTAGAKNVTVIGGSGNDTLTKVTAWTGGEIRGGNGNDTINTSDVAAAFKIQGENGDDTLTFKGTSTVLGGLGTDTITQADKLAAVINGGDGTDTINLGGGAAGSLATVQMGAASTWGDTINKFTEAASKSVLAFSVSSGYAQLSNGTSSNSVNFLNAAGTTVGANNTVVVNQTANAAVTTAASLQAANWSIVAETAGDHYIVIQANSATQATVFDVVSANTDGFITAADTVTLVGTLTGMTAVANLVAGNFSVV